MPKPPAYYREKAEVIHGEAASRLMEKLEAAMESECFGFKPFRFIVPDDEYKAEGYSNVIWDIIAERMRTIGWSVSASNIEQGLISSVYISPIEKEFS